MHPSVRYRITKSLKHDMIQAACGKFIIFTSYEVQKLVLGGSVG